MWYKLRYLLYCSGHDRPELYALEIPDADSVLKLVEIILFEGNGQGIAFDRTAPGILYGIKRSKKELVAAKLPTSRR